MIISSPNGDISVSSVAQPSHTLSSLSSDTFANRNVTPEGALAIGAVYGAVTLLSTLVTTMPLDTYERVSDGRTERVEPMNSTVAMMLGGHPNPEMNAGALWSTVMANLLLRGNAYLAKIRGRSGKVVALWPVPSELVRVFRDSKGNKIFRLYRSGIGEYEDFTSEAILHVPYLSFDGGLVGHSPIAVMRNRLGVPHAASETQAKMFKQGTLIRGVIKTQRTLNDESIDRLRRDWEGLYSGADNAFRTPVLENGMDFEPISMPAKDAEFVNQMKFSASEIATMFQVPSSFLNAEGASLTYTNAAQNDLQLHKYSLAPKLAYIEQALASDAALFGAASRRFPLFRTDNVLRTDAKTRAEVAKTWIEAGVKTPNEVRDENNLKPLDEGSDADRAMNAGLAAQRLGVAANYGVLSPDEARDVLGLEELDGPAPVIEPRDVPQPDPEDRAQPQVAFHVHQPEMRGVTDAVAELREQPPVVNVHVPEQPAPQVDIDVHVPEQDAPTVRVEPRIDVHVPEQPAPEVRVDVEAPSVEVNPQIHVPKQQGKTLEIQRDSKGNILGATVKEEDYNG